MKTLLQINVLVNSGSTGRIAEEIGQLAIKNSWESYIAFGRNDRSSESHKIKIGNAFDIKWHGIQTRFFDRHGLASKKATKGLIEKIKEINPDIIHLHNIHGYYLNIEVLFNYLSSIETPVVWTLHDCWPLTGHCAHFSFVGCDKWRTLCYNCPQKKSYPGSLFWDRSQPNYILKKRLFTAVNNLTVVTVSNWLKDIVAESFMHSFPIKRIYNGVNTEVFTPINDCSALKKKYSINTEFVLLGVASIWSERKGFQDFLKLSNHLSADISIVLIGLTERQIKDLPYNIIGVKRTESVHELAEWYNLADLFINPTWEDNFPTTNLEALACGTPILTYKTGGSVEAVTPETGFVVEQGDINGILRCIDEVRQKGKGFYHQACRNRALELYRKEDRYAEYLKLYNDLLK